MKPASATIPQFAPTFQLKRVRRNAMLRPYNGGGPFLMTLAPRTRLGAFEIISPLGSGGMGDVYRARDSALKREVAIKVLPDSLAKHTERVARFEREARLLASMNHPNIGAIYDHGQEDGLFFLVLELVEGKTLRELMGDAVLPRREVF